MAELECEFLGQLLGVTSWFMSVSTSTSSNDDIGSEGAEYEDVDLL